MRALGVVVVFSFGLPGAIGAEDLDRVLPASLVSTRAPGSVAREIQPPVRERVLDRVGPAIEFVPPAAYRAGAPVVIQARIADPSGVAQAWVAWRVTATADFAIKPLLLGHDGSYHATLPAPETARRVECYLGARDGRGNAAQVRSAADPLRVAIVRSAAEAARREPADRSGWVLLSLALALSGVALVRRHLARGDAPAGAGVPAPPGQTDIAFWRGVLGPVRDLRGDELASRLRRMARQKIAHPILGERKFPETYLRAKLDVLIYKG